MIFSLIKIYFWCLLAGIMLGVVIQLTMSFVLTKLWVRTMLSNRRRPRILARFLIADSAIFVAINNRLDGLVRPKGKKGRISRKNH